MTRRPVVDLPPTLEQRIRAGRVCVGVLRGEVRVVADDGSVLASMPAAEAARRILGSWPPDRPVRIALAAVGGGREIRIRSDRPELLVAAEERSAVFRLLEGTSAWDERRTDDPRMIRPPAAVPEADAPPVPPRFD